MDHQPEENGTLVWAQRYKLIFLVAFLIFAAYQSLGIFPVAPVEGDGIATANGTIQFVSSGLCPNPLVYAFYGRSGTFVLIAALHKLTGLDPFTLFSLASGFSSIIFVLFSAFLIGEITGYPFGISGIVVLLFQESFVGGYYANNTVMSAALALPALYLLKVSRSGRTHVLSGILLGLAAWVRFDIVLLAPACFFMIHQNGWKWSLYRTLFVGIIASIVGLVVMYFSGDSIPRILSSLLSHKAYAASDGGSGILGKFIGSHLTLFSLLLMFLTVVGLFRVILRRKWYLLGMSCFSIAPIYIFLGTSIINPRLLYYFIPFFSLPAVYALSWSKRIPRKRQIVYLSTAILLFAFQYLIGLEIKLDEIYYPKRYGETLFNIKDPMKFKALLSVRLGTGLGLNTDVGGRVWSGLFYVPLWWHRTKSSINEELEKLHSFLTVHDGDVINLCAREWKYIQMTRHIFFRMGYSFESKKREKNTRARRYVFKKDNRIGIASELPRDNFEACFTKTNASTTILLASPKEFLSRPGPEWEAICDFAYVRASSKE